MQKPNTTPPSPMVTAIPPPDCWKLGGWLVEPACNCISNSDEKRLLEPRVMTALEVLLNANGQTVTDQQLVNAVWPNVVVSDSSLYQVVTQLRKALQDQHKPYQLIERVQRKGYRLLQQAERLPADPSRQPTTLLTVTNTARWSESAKTRWIFSSILLVILLLVTLRFYSGRIDTSSSQQPHNTVNKAVAGREQLTPAEGFSDADWSMLQQALYLSNQPREETITEAVQFLRLLLPSYPDYPPLLVGLCNSYHAMHIYSDWSLQKVLALCDPLLQQALQQQMDYAPALGSFGALQLSRQNLAGAVYYLDKAIQLQPKDPHTLLWRAALYRIQGQYDEAVTLMATATELAPFSGLLKRHYAYSLLGNGQLSRARAVFQHALLLEGNYSDRALDELELLPLTSQRAMAFLQWAARFPDRLNSPERWAQLSLVQLSLQQISLAENSLQQAASMSDKNPFVLLAQAMLAEAQGQSSKANSYLQQRLSLQPQHTIFQLQALFLSSSEATLTRQKALYRLLPAYEQDAVQAMEQDLANNEQLKTLYFLLSLPTIQRQAYQSMISGFVSNQHAADSLSVQLLCAVGLIEQANQLALQLLDNDWLPSPHDDYYVTEQHPLLQQLSSEFFSKLEQQRQKVLQALTAGMPNRVPYKEPH